MVGTEHSIAAQVRAAKTDPEAADALIGQYMGFIRSETVKFTRAAPESGREDELSIAMLAFYEAILHYEKSRGAFLPYAGRAIRSRLIDHYRAEKRHGKVISLHASPGEDGDRPMEETLPDTRDEIGAYETRTASQQEIREFGEQLGRFGISFSDVADNCPKQQRTLDACRKALEYAKENPELLEDLLKMKRLPIGQLAMGSGGERKTLERHRKYMVALLLIYTNGYEIIRGHLKQVMKGVAVR